MKTDSAVLTFRQLLTLFPEIKPSSHAPAFLAPHALQLEGLGLYSAKLEILRRPQTSPGFSPCQRVCVWRWTYPDESPVCDVELSPEFGFQVRKPHFAQ